MNKIVFDIGGTTIEYIFFNDQNIESKFKKNIIKVGKKNKDQILKIIAHIINDTNVDELKIGISSPTAINTITGFCKGISGIKGYENFNLYEELKSLITIKKYTIKAINDANAALLGIIDYHFQKPPKSVFMISLGTGIGGSLYLNGKLFLGHNRMAGEIGYPIWKDKNSVSQLLSPVNFFQKIYPNMTVKQIFSSFSLDAQIMQSIHKWLYELSKLINFLCFIINPEYIVFTGGVTKNPTFQYLLPIIYDKYCSNNKLANFLTTKIKFYDDNINYAILGAQKIVDE